MTVAFSIRWRHDHGELSEVKAAEEIVKERGQAMDVFQRTDPPMSNERSATALGKWFTWSNQVYQIIDYAKSILEQLPTPLVHLTTEAEGFDYTYFLPLDAIRDEAVVKGIRDVARSLRNVDVGSNIMLFTDAVNDRMTGEVLHAFLAGIRTAMVEESGDTWCAIHATPMITGEQVGALQLHADLYVGRTLLNIFEDVARDETGESLLLSSDDFLRLLDTLPSMPASERRRACSLLTAEHEEDRFDDFYTLLYGAGKGFDREPHPWTEELQVAMNGSCARVKMQKGQGYLLDDRRWLHGRTAPTGGVPIRRMHRLVFRPASAIQR